MIIRYVFSKTKKNLVEKKIGFVIQEAEPFLQDNLSLRERVWESYSPVPIGVIVATGPKPIGWSKCADFDHFNKKIGKQIATSRAISGNFGILPKCMEKDFLIVKELVKSYRWDEDK